MYGAGGSPSSNGAPASLRDDGVGFQRRDRDAGLEGSATVEVHVQRRAVTAAAAAAERDLGEPSLIGDRVVCLRHYTIRKKRTASPML